MTSPLKLLFAIGLVITAAWYAWHLAGPPKQRGSADYVVAMSRVDAPVAPSSSLPAGSSDTQTPVASLPPTPVSSPDKPDHEPIGVRLNRWLLSSADLNVVAENIANAFPTVKPQDHAVVIHELIPLVPDEHYPRLGRILLNSKTHPNALNMLFRNLGYRPDYIELPMNLELMRMGERHPLSEDARIKLSVRFGEDYGNDWNKWQTRIAEELKDR